MAACILRTFFFKRDPSPYFLFLDNHVFIWTYSHVLHGKTHPRMLMFSKLSKFFLRWQAEKPDTILAVVCGALNVADGTFRTCMDDFLHLLER